ncbi:MAG: GumC family protein [Terriglobales bacterium]
MEGQELIIHPGQAPVALTTRDMVAMGFRHRKALLISFFAVLLATAITAEILPRYEAHTEILVHRERVDPVASAQPGSPVVVNDTVSEEELNSEAELLKSDDVIRPVVLTLGLEKQNSKKWIFFHRKPEEALSKAVSTLKSGLRVEPLPKTNIVKVTLPSGNPREAALILETLDQVYLQKHKELHNPAGQFAFFDGQAKQAQAELAASEAKLKAFPSVNGTPNPLLARDVALQKINDFNFSMGQTRADLAETQQRLDSLQKMKETTDPRLLAQQRTAEDGSGKDMKSKLLDLEIRRSDMASKYQADYPPLLELEREIAITKGTITNNKPMNDVTTDRNPTYQWINDEIVKEKAQITGDAARISEIESVIAQNMENVRKLDSANIELQDLARTAKNAEDNFLLYSRKREEARISDALDATQIVNVVIQERPSVPVYPAQSGWLFALIGSVLALTVSAATVFVKERMDASFRTPVEVETILNLPVLAAVPGQNGNGHHSNGRGRKVLPADLMRESR